MERHLVYSLFINIGTGWNNIYAEMKDYLRCLSIQGSVLPFHLYPFHLYPGEKTKKLPPRVDVNDVLLFHPKDL